MLTESDNPPVINYFTYRTGGLDIRIYKLGYNPQSEVNDQKRKIMTNDNIHVTNAEMAEASTLVFDKIAVFDKPIEDFFDAEGNLIPFDLDETFVQADEDLGESLEVDVANTSH